MKLRNVLTIFRKDVFDAVRDTRVLVALLVPLGIGLFYGLAFDDEAMTSQQATVAHTAATGSLPETLRATAGDAADLTFEERAGEAAVRRAVERGEADVGLVAGSGFEEAVGRGEAPGLTVVLPEDPGPGDAVAAFLDPALGQMAGQAPPAEVRTETVGKAESGGNVLMDLGLRTYFVLVSVVLMVGMISLFVVPIILAEEAEKKTLDALTLVATSAEVVVAKALVGALYVAVAVPLLLALVGLSPDDPTLFAAGVGLLALSLVGFGLLVGGVLRNANQVNTWAGVLLLPVVAPAFMVGAGLPDAAETFASLTPVGAATKLAVNGMGGEAVFGGLLVSVAVILAWALAGYALLAWTLRRREA